MSTSSPFLLFFNTLSDRLAISDPASINLLLKTITPDSSSLSHLLLQLEHGELIRLVN